MRAWALVLLALVPACDESPAPPAPVPEAVRYEGLEEVAEAVGCSGVEDLGTGDNAGLEEFGTCHIGSANLDVYVTSERALWEHLADLFPSVLGPNWIVVSPSGVEGARLVQERLGGELRTPPSPSPT